MSKRFYRVFLPCCVLAAVVLACTGSSLDEEMPGGMLGTYLESGQIAVDPRTETSFVMRQSIAQAAPGAPPPTQAARRALYAVRADATSAELVTRLDDTSDARLMFPATGTLLMSEQGGGELLRLLDGETHREIRRRSTRARYHGTRLSPSGRWIAVADNDDDDVPIHLLDAATLETIPIPHDGQWLEAMWMNGSDRLAAIVAYDIGQPAERMRLLVWDISALEQKGFEIGELGYWVEPEIDVTVEGVGPDIFFSFTWVGVSPNDRFAVFPVLGQPETADGQRPHRLLVLELASADVRVVEDAYGPVGFTPDGSTIVSYRYGDGTGETRSFLRLVDVQTLETEDVELPLLGLPEYFVSRDGNLVVVADLSGQDQLVLVDIDQQRVTQMAGPGVAFRSFVARPGHRELWLADAGLYRVDLMAATVESMTLSVAAAHVNYLPARDQLVLVPEDVSRLAFFDPNGRNIVREVAIPDPR